MFIYFFFYIKYFSIWSDDFAWHTGIQIHTLSLAECQNSGRTKIWSFKTPSYTQNVKRCTYFQDISGIWNPYIFSTLDDISSRPVWRRRQAAPAALHELTREAHYQHNRQLVVKLTKNLLLGTLAPLGWNYNPKYRHFRVGNRSRCICCSVRGVFKYFSLVCDR